MCRLSTVSIRNETFTKTVKTFVRVSGHLSIQVIYVAMVNSEVSQLELRRYL